MHKKEQNHLSRHIVAFSLGTINTMPAETAQFNRVLLPTFKEQTQPMRYKSFGHSTINNSQ